MFMATSYNMATVQIAARVVIVWVTQFIRYFHNIDLKKFSTALNTRQWILLSNQSSRAWLTKKIRFNKIVQAVIKKNSMLVIWKAIIPSLRTHYHLDLDEIDKWYLFFTILSPDVR